MSTLPLPSDMSGRVVVLTGGSSGIGAAAATTLAALGAEIALVGRDPERTRGVAERVGATPFVADFGRLDEVRRLGADLLARYPRIDVLANNAGGIVPVRAYTVDRNERTLQESVLAGFLLTTLLLPRIVETAETAEPGSVRIIQTASNANRGGHLRLDDLDTISWPWLSGWRAYNRAKLANILVTRELARRLAPTEVSAYAFHPGLVNTRFGEDNLSLQLLTTLSGGRAGLSAEEGADPLVRLAAAPAIPAASGTYFSRLHANGATAPQADDADFARRLWAALEERSGAPRTQAASARPSRQ